MPKTVSATEARIQLCALIRWSVENDDAVIIENRGQPRATIIPIEEYEKLQELRQQMRRQEADASD